MKKLEKLTLKEMSNHFDILELKVSKNIKGGWTPECGYSWGEYDKIEQQGCWRGGLVEGCWIGATTTVTYDSASTRQMSYGELIYSQQESVWSVVGDAAIQAACDWNPVTAYLHDVAASADDVIRIAQQNQLNDALNAIWNCGSADNRCFNVTYVNGALSIYDEYGNLFYRN